MRDPPSLKPARSQPVERLPADCSSPSVGLRRLNGGASLEVLALSKPRDGIDLRTVCLKSQLEGRCEPAFGSRPIFSGPGPGLRSRPVRTQAGQPYSERQDGEPWAKDRKVGIRPRPSDARRDVAGVLGAFLLEDACDLSSVMAL